MAGLDDLDLDDMFNDDGDNLFEGLDIELDGMGDIISNEKKETLAPTVPPPPRRPGGPRTKRTNPMIEKASQEGEASKRRKTKRKSKAPTVLGDDDEGLVEEQPKKKRKAALKSKTVTEPIVVKTKRKKSNDEIIPIPAQVSAAPPNMLPAKSKIVGQAVVVAAAGQFGNRFKRRSVSSTGATKVKRRTKKPGDVESEAPRTIAVAPKPDPLKVPKPEPTFGGLAPSQFLFYPFLESVPPEPSMQKRKAYPTLDKINSVITTQMSHHVPTPVPVATLSDPSKQRNHTVSDDSPIFKLMVETYEGSDKDTASIHEEKRAAILRGIPELRGMIQALDRQRLVKDVFSMCWLLTRQYNFIKQSLENMEVWCKGEFTEEDYKATYDPPLETPKFLKWRAPTIRLKLVLKGYKDPKSSSVLIGVLPPMVVDALKPTIPVLKPKPVGTKKAVSSPKIPAPTKTKKKKERTTEKPKSKTTVMMSTAASSVYLPKTYSASSPHSRRHQIIERISQLALELEYAQRVEAVGEKLQVIPEEDPPLQTSRMWEFMKTAGFYKNPQFKHLDLRSPEMHPRGLYLSVPTKIRGRDESVTHVSSYSLFDRLQSMLVVEDDAPDVIATANGESEDSDCEISLSFLDDDDSDLNDQASLNEVEPCDDHQPDLLDLSALSLEERTFIHLSRAGLIRTSVFPAVELVATQTNEQNDEGSAPADDLVNVIGEMSSDLSAITSTNNRRISYLELAMAEADLQYGKQVEDENAAIISKCHSMMKRSKERAKKAKQKKDENLNLPW